jgi:hypothetical protein
MTSYYALLNKIEAFCDAHLQIKKFAGEFREQMPNFCTQDERYPIVFVVPNGNLPTLNQNEFTVDIYCVDIIQKDRQNLNVILSDTQLILNDLYLYFSDGPDFSVDITSSPTLAPLNNFDLDYCAGWSMNVTFQVNGYCVEGIPMNPIVPGEVTCEPAHVQNSNLSYSVDVSSGNTLALPDTNIKIFDQDGNVLSNAAYPSVSSQSVTVTCPTCPDPIINIKKEGDGTIASLTLGCGTTTDYYVHDNHISVNGTFETTIDATDPLDILVKDQNTNTITPSSIVYNGNQHHITLNIDTSSFIPCGAELIKTGQTTSFRTGDDGDFEAGRKTSITQMLVNNPFGNTNRFTDELGGQTYTKKWVVDWSTFDGTYVLGYYTNVLGPYNWNGCIDNSLGVHGTFNKCRLINARELMNIARFDEVNGCLNYAPFNLPTTYYGTSTTQSDNTGNSVYLYAAANPIMNAWDKTITANRAIPVRNFKVNGTNLS